jgi:hypothetical protein
MLGHKARTIGIDFKQSAIASNGTVYVGDIDGHRVQKCEWVGSHPEEGGACARSRLMPFWTAISAVFLKACYKKDPGTHLNLQPMKYSGKSLWITITKVGLPPILQSETISTNSAYEKDLELASL